MLSHRDKLETMLRQMITFVEAREKGHRNQSKLTESRGLNRVSEYRWGKEFMKQESRPLVRPTPSTMGCSNCGSKTHSSKVSDRRMYCKAFNVDCRKCGRQGHFKNSCRSKPQNTKAEKQKEEPVEQSTVQDMEHPPEDPDSPHANWPRYGAGEVSELSQPAFF